MKPLNQEEISQRFLQFVILLMVTILIIIGVVFVNYHYPGEVISKLKAVALKQTEIIDSLNKDKSKLQFIANENSLINDSLMNLSTKLIQNLKYYFNENDDGKIYLISTNFENVNKRMKNRFPNYENKFDSIFADIKNILNVKQTLKEEKDNYKKLEQEKNDIKKDLKECRQEKKPQNPDN